MALKMIAKETIRPSNPTPPHLQNFKMSLLDQIMVPIYIPLVLLYPPIPHGGKNTSQIISHLKDSLAKTLTRFYPLAGRMKKDHMTLDCNDSGVAFIVAHMDCHFDNLLKNPCPDSSLGDLVPFKTKFFPDTHTEGLVGVQVTTFDCGALAIGVCIDHRISDATSVTNFVKSWAEEARMATDVLVKYPDFTTARNLFPPIDSVEVLQNIGNQVSSEAKPCVQRRYFFNKNAIASLQAKASNKSTPNPTRNEALTSFIWKHLTEASGTITSTSFTSVAYVAINLRPRFNPPVSSNCFGNLSFFANGSFYFSNDGETKPEISQLADELHRNIASADSDFVAKLQQPGAIPQILAGSVSSNMVGGVVKWFGFTNWCNMGHYGIDFGWGTPVLTGFVHKKDVSNNRGCVLMDSPSGIEVYVTEEETVVSIVERNPEFVEFASINPMVTPYEL